MTNVIMDEYDQSRKGTVFEQLRVVEKRHYFKKNTRVCRYWLAGICNRNPCRFLHHLDSPQKPPQCHDSKFTWRNPNLPTSKNLTSEHKNGHVVQKQLCKYWVSGNCVNGDRCKDLHSWSCGTGFSLMTNLETRHNKTITGIALASGSDKLFSSSKDESVCIWDCNSGQCVSTIKPGGEIGCLMSEGSWVFVGLQNSIKAWNIQTQTELVLSGPHGLVLAMVVGDDILFGGVQDGSILAWKSSSKSSNSPELLATLKGHMLAVLSLAVGANRLYSGSKDDTIRVWDLKTLQCLQKLNGHKNFVTSLVSWGSYLFSGSLDNTLKVWGATDQSEILEVIHEVKEESGIIALRGIHDAEAKPILLCSCKDNAVRLYDLPSFAERGRIFAKREVQSIEGGYGGLFFTGDSTGQLSVWKFNEEPSQEAMKS